jgi:type VI secretion system secreted protein VgrG
MADSFEFQCGDVTADNSHVMAFELLERLGAPFELSVHLDCRDDALVSDEHLARPATLTIAERKVHGVVRRNELLLAVGTRRIHRLVLGPPLAALADTLHSRSFVDKSIPDVIEHILGENEITDYELRLSETYPPRVQVTQYRESDLAFLHRWMEREGITYYFAHDDSKATLVITDDKDQHHELPGGRIRFVGAREDWNIGDHLRSWGRAHAAATKEVDLGDYDYLKPALAIREQGESGALGFESLVRFEDNLWDSAEAKHKHKVAAQREGARQVRFRGEGRVHGIHAGARFQLEEHPRDGFNQRYYAVEVRHQGSRLTADAALAHDLGIPPSVEGYQVRVEALPSDVAYRPLRTPEGGSAPWPRVQGLEHALVDGGADSPYAQIDAEGRYRVQFLFDELGSPAGQQSAWLRMLQPHGGAPEGYHFPLRKGTEVLVAFVHGDPDRPYLVGAVPNPKTPSPVTSSNHTLNVLQTGSRNRVEIDDQDGAQYIDISTPPENTFVHLGAHAGLGDHNIVISTDGDGLHHAGGNRDLTVGGNQTEEVTGNLTEEYSSNQTTHVFAAFKETIDSGETQTISAGSKQTIDGGLKQTITGGDKRTVTGGLTETITGDRTQKIVGATDETIDAALTQTVTGAITITTPSTFTLNAPPGINWMTPAAGLINGLGGVSIVAPGSQMTVDGEFIKVGEDFWLRYLIRATAGIFRLGLTGFWLRRLGNHLAVYGIKVDIKGTDDKSILSDKKAVGAEIRAGGKWTIMKALIQFN